ncbi:uncharacterized protein [Procambarus clarkii]|uniref:uncharacterized protein isoform X2 n=1 Tax=Procambarus clarkii TaxID=6728 RepID=UPI001E672165|nr:uncharacterized protein LOC123751228 [Procambarus clarkii]
MKLLLLSALLFAIVVVGTTSQRTHYAGSSCPDPNSFGRVCIQYYDQCTSDQECRTTGRGHKCCLVAGCGKECMN